MLLMDKASPISGGARGFVRFGENAADTQLAGGERREIRRQPGEDLADAQETRGRRAFAGGSGRHQPSEDAARSTGETKKFSRNFPTRTSAPLVSVARSTRSPLT